MRHAADFRGEARFFPQWDNGRKNTRLTLAISEISYKLRQQKFGG